MVTYRIVLEMEIPKNEKNKNHKYDNDLIIKHYDNKPYLTWLFDTFEHEIEYEVGFEGSELEKKFDKKIDNLSAQTFRKKLPFVSNNEVTAELFDSDNVHVCEAVLDD